MFGLNLASVDLFSGTAVQTIPKACLGFSLIKFSLEPQNSSSFASFSITYCSKLVLVL